MIPQLIDDLIYDLIDASKEVAEANVSGWGVHIANQRLNNVKRELSQAIAEEIKEANKTE